ncbi:sensor domain-containing diguanylate cyclase [Winogradskya consettensis]|uniref:sensor domain-containing diguanylate cyclase n=1 Tax=Winogradskya consettensis TaxID=113560 RepID=UPI001BB3C784|nr:diguanylate cyclase [Actinoplanes consettensis]
MTLRGRLTAAFLAVVLGPVLLGSFFVGMTVATVSRDRTAERLDHAVTTVRTAIGAMCRQLQAVADAVAVLPVADQRTAADQMVTRGLASEVRIAPAGSTTTTTTGGAIGERDCAAADQRGQAGAADPGQPAVPAEGGPVQGGPVQGGPVQGGPVQGGPAQGSPGQVGAGQGSGVGEAVTAVGARAVQDDVVVVALERIDGLFIRRLGDSSAARVEVAVGEVSGAAGRRIPVEPGQPLPVSVEVRSEEPAVLYVFLAVAVFAVAGLAVLAARWLARSTTRPLEELAWAAGKVADGELGVRVPVGRGDEIGQLAGTFNRMTRELQAYVQALTASRDQLRGHLAILGDTLSSTHDVHRILQVILQTALSATGARAGVVLLIDPGEAVLVARCAEGLTGRWDVPEGDLPSLRIPVGHGILGVVAAGGEARRGFCDLGGGPMDEPAGRTYVAVPICAPATVGDPLVPGGLMTESGQPAILGVLALYDRLGADEFDDTDLHTLRTFAGQAGVAVHNVRVHEEAQRLSLTDPLTGLWNYRCLRESLRREVERATRFGRMLTVLVLDLDHFKDVNDTYGHAAGDVVLGEFARRIRIGLREVDVAFRQGGEEFVVLLPETDAYGGIIVAERLGSAVRDIPVPIDPRRMSGGAGVAVDRVAISVSIGIAVYPEHGATAQQVLDAADDALYAAKNAGRDTYRLAESIPLPAVDVTDPSVSRGVADGKTDQQGPVAGASGGPQPPRQARGR